jgi:hypothetical protein
MQWTVKPEFTPDGGCEFPWLLSVLQQLLAAA